MEYLFNLGFNENEIKNIITTNNEVMDLNDEEIKSLVMILVNIGCKDYHIKNIIIAIIIINSIFYPPFIYSITSLIASPIILFTSATKILNFVSASK